MRVKQKLLLPFAVAAETERGWLNHDIPCALRALPPDGVLVPADQVYGVGEHCVLSAK